MSSPPLIPQAKFKSVTVVSTFELGAEEGSVLQLTEASRWSEVGPEAKAESCENGEGGDRVRAPVGFFRKEVCSRGVGSDAPGSRVPLLSFLTQFLSLQSSVSRLALLYNVG